MNTPAISAKMFGGYYDGKEIKLPSDLRGDLRLPLPSATQQSDETWIRYPFMAAVYLQNKKDTTRWEYVGII